MSLGKWMRNLLGMEPKKKPEPLMAQRIRDTKNPASSGDFFAPKKAAFDAQQPKPGPARRVTPSTPPKPAATSRRRQEEDRRRRNDDSGSYSDPIDLNISWGRSADAPAAPAPFQSGGGGFFGGGGASGGWGGGDSCGGDSGGDSGGGGGDCGGGGGGDIHYAVLDVSSTARHAGERITARMSFGM